LKGESIVATCNPTINAPGGYTAAIGTSQQKAAIAASVGVIMYIS
jgi:hypothetical protein